MWKYEAPARLHITLYDMNGSLGRINGGLGFSVNNPKFVFYIEKSENIEIIYKCKEDKEQKEYIYEELKLIKKVYNLLGVKLIIENIIPAHRGFGSKSITKLSMAKAYLELYDKEVDIKELAVILKRGGTSGIGVNILEKGGFVFDGGRKKKKDITFKPSSAQSEIEVPPVLFHKEMLDIPIYILIPKMQGLHDEKEIDFFEKVCPISDESVEKLARIINSQILPALCENDFEVFCDGINKIQHLQWKISEINMYPTVYKQFIFKLQEKGYGCGMSSAGTAIYVMGKNFDVLQQEIKMSNIEFENIILTHTNNVGIIRSNINDSFDNG